MHLHYIIHPADIIELIVNNHDVNNMRYIELLEDVLRANNILTQQSLYFSSTRNDPNNSSTFIYINYSHFNKILIRDLEKNGFIVTPHRNNKMFVYYIKHSENTIKLFFANSEKRYSEFIILNTFLNNVLNAIKNSNFIPTENTESDIFTVKTCLSSYSITLCSKYLFTGLPSKILGNLREGKYADSIIAFLKLNGFALTEHTTKLSPHDFNKLKLKP